MNEFMTTHPSDARKPRTLMDDIKDFGQKHPRLITLSTVGSICIAAATLIGHQNAEARAGSIHEGDRDTTITSVQLENGAIIRSEPRVTGMEFDNTLHRLDLGDGRFISIPTENGVYTEDDNNGNWYGIPAENLTDIADVNVGNDRDGIVWVNAQTATPVTNQSND